MAATKTYPNILKYGLQANYDALATKDSAVLYFCTDTKKIYKGTVDFTDAVIVAATKPAASIVAGKLYVIADTGTVEVYDGTAWHVVSYPTTTAISVSSTDVEVASAKAIYTFVEEEIGKVIGGDSVIKAVEVSAEEGKIKVTNGKGVATDVAVHGAVTTPTYDATTRKFTFPVVDGEDVVVELGTDIFIDPTGDNSYHADTKEIWLTLNDGSTGKEPTVIKIPAAGLVNILSGVTSDSAKVTIDNAAGTVKAEAVLRASSESFTNALKISTTAGDTGLYVDLAAYATIEYVDDEIKRVEDKADKAQATADTNTTAIGVLNGDASTEGSVAKAIATLKSELENGDIATLKSDVATNKDNIAANKTAIDTLNGTGAGSVAKAVSDAVDALDATVSQAAAADNGQVAVEIVETDGKLVSVKASVAANTYDAYGAAAAVQGATTKTVADAVADAAAAQATADENTENLAALAASVIWGTF